MTHADTAPHRTPLRAIIFDLDGTLIDSMPLVLRAFAHALAPYRPDLDEDAIFLRLGGPPERTLLELTGDEAQAAGALARLEEFGFENGALVQPFAGMRVMLDALRARGLSLAIWTGRDRGTTEAIFEAHALEGYFSEAVCGDDLPTHKPHPEGLMAILRRLNLHANEVLYVGDADADVLGGDEAGVRTILIRHGREVDAGVSAKAWCVVDKPAEAYACIADAVASQN